ncbi:hypothetical protein DMC30DRAFT_390374 [Rhodotorula diobovata]|uniref:Uncharacterized protein n=1 Tax=Rhodotorula diobovata TaxID=5288 RepID=A0A5C5G463_9BASI|nr:hypothetical protein DMC30DRAFT_390374 [Rhodotorula diobovata]
MSQDRLITEELALASEYHELALQRETDLNAHPSAGTIDELDRKLAHTLSKYKALAERIAASKDDGDLVEDCVWYHDTVAKRAVQSGPSLDPIYRCRNQACTDELFKRSEHIERDILALHPARTSLVLYTRQAAYDRFDALIERYRLIESGLAKTMSDLSLVTECDWAAGHPPVESNPRRPLSLAQDEIYKAELSGRRRRLQQEREAADQSLSVLAWRRSNLPADDHFRERLDALSHEIDVALLKYKNCLRLEARATLAAGLRAWLATMDAELAEHGSLFYQLDHLRHDVIKHELAGRERAEAQRRAHAAALHEGSQADGGAHSLGVRGHKRASVGLRAARRYFGERY